MKAPTALVALTLVLSIGLLFRAEGASTDLSFPRDEPRASRTRPNILFVFSDDHATSAIGAYGSALVETPHLDRLAREGMRFDNCFCTESICRPRRTTVLTGKYGHVTGGMGWASYDRAAHRTFPEYLQQAGYQTALFGKYHIGEDPPGFDTYAILPGQGRYRNPELIWSTGRRVHEGHVSDVIVDLAIEWLDERADDRPFLLCVQDKATHMPWEPAPRHESTFEGVDLPEPETLFFDLQHPERPASSCHVSIDTLPHWMTDYWGAPPQELSQRERRRWLWQVYVKDYLRTAAGIDDGLGRMLDYLDDHGLRERTIVVYSSDQGFFLGEKNLFDKRWMYEPCLRMPLIVSCPPLVEAGAVNTDLVVNTDFAPTFLELAGLEVPADMQGRSLVPLMRGRTPDDWREAMYYRLYVNEYNIPPQYGIRTSRYKLIHFEGSGRPLRGREDALVDVDRWELYDLEADPDELIDLHDRPEHRTLVKRLQDQLSELRTRLGDDG